MTVDNCFWRQRKDSLFHGSLGLSVFTRARPCAETDPRGYVTHVCLVWSLMTGSFVEGCNSDFRVQLQSVCVCGGGGGWVIGLIGFGAGWLYSVHGALPPPSLILCFLLSHAKSLETPGPDQMLKPPLTYSVDRKTNFTSTATCLFGADLRT